MNYNAVSLFTGAGGLDIGIERAGFTIIAANDLDSTFCETLVHNQQKRIATGRDDGSTHLESASIINADVRTLSGSDLSPRRDIHLVMGGPPCQPFSSAGKMEGMRDVQGTLFFDFARIVADLSPQCLLFENVRGLVTSKDDNGTPGGVFVQIINSFEDLGYSCRVGLLNAADYGSYQRRVRCFLIGVRHGVAPAFPEVSFANPTDSRLAIKMDIGAPQSHWRTLGEFLELYGDENENTWQRPSEFLAKQLSSLANGTGLKSPGVVEATRPGGHWGYKQGGFIADPALPARTITGSSSQDWVRLPDGSLRRLTLSEISRLQGFPEEWEFSGTKSKQYKQIGNAVPSIFGEMIGQELITYLKNIDVELPPTKLPIPQRFQEYIAYTKRENDRNAESRLRGQRLQQP